VDRLPAFWDCSVVFVANLLSLFLGNAQQRQVLEGEIHTGSTVATVVWRLS